MKNVKRTLGAVLLGVSLATVAAALVLLGMVPAPFGPLAEARATAEKARPPVTVMYPTRERIVNLADAGSPRYVKTQITLEFLDRARKEAPKGEAVKAQQEEFAKEMSAHAAIVEDKLNAVLSSKSSAELLNPAGRDKLKDELADKLTKALHGEEEVVRVYFVTFIVQ